MASVKVKFRKSTVKGRPGTIYYQICHNNQHRQITTNIHILPENWNKDYDNIIDRNDNKLCNLKIHNDLQIINNIISDLNQSLRTYTISDIISRFNTSAENNTVFEYMNRQINLLREKHKYGTAENYKCALNSFAAFLKNHDEPFSIINDITIQNYSSWLEQRNVKKNSISFYMRIWRAVYNKAVRDNIVEQTYPFNNVYTGIEHTVKRAVREETILKIMKLDLAKKPQLSLTRDIFLFSYCTRGMSFVDIAFLKKSNIHNNMLTYYRRKTGQELSVYIEPCIKNIINKYHTVSTPGDFVFPIIRSMKDAVTAERQYHLALNRYNKKLKILAKMARVGDNISSYTSRHSWATTARNHNIPISIISAGMGHTSERTTQIYLASLENSVIDDANKNVLSEINRYTSC